MPYSKFSLNRFGDWARANVVLQGLAQNLTPAFITQIEVDGELILFTLREHIENQDLNWVPNSDNYVKRVARNGEDAVWVDTGFLYDNLKVMRVRSRKNGVTFFVGADSHIYEPRTGYSLSDVFIWNEYGTLYQPPRPLLRPTWDELKPVLERNWRNLLKDMVDVRGGIKGYSR